MEIEDYISTRLKFTFDTDMYACCKRQLINELLDLQIFIKNSKFEELTKMEVELEPV